MTDKNVLIIENEPQIAALLVAIFQSYDRSWRCQVADSAESATVFLRAQPEWEFIMADLGLSDAGGLEIIKLIKEIQPLAKPFVMTGLVDDALKERAIHVGVLGYYYKPIENNAQLCFDIKLELIKYEKSLADWKLAHPQIKKKLNWKFWAKLVALIGGAAAAVIAVVKELLKWK